MNYIVNYCFTKFKTSFSGKLFLAYSKPKSFVIAQRGASHTLPFSLLCVLRVSVVGKKNALSVLITSASRVVNSLPQPGLAQVRMTTASTLQKQKSPYTQKYKVRLKLFLVEMGRIELTVRDGY